MGDMSDSIDWFVADYDLGKTKGKRMGTTEHTIEGIASWAKITVPDDFNGVKRWKINIAMDDANLKIYKASGCRVGVKDEENGPTVSLSKKCEAPKWATTWEAPKVTLNGADFDGLIGNGSKVKVSFSVYDTSMGKGHRLGNIDILDLVPYVRDEDAPANEPADTVSQNSSDDDKMTWEK